MDLAVLTLAELGDDVSDVYAWVDANARENCAGVEAMLPQLHVLSQELSATLQQRLENFPSFDTHVQLLAIKTEGLRQNLQSVTTPNLAVPSLTTDSRPVSNGNHHLPSSPQLSSNCALRSFVFASAVDHGQLVIDHTA